MQKPTDFCTRFGNRSKGSGTRPGGWLRRQRELEKLQEEAEGHRVESREDSESSGSWRTESEETEERESQRWRSTVDPESEESEGLEGSKLEVEKEMDKEIDEEMMLQ